MIPGVDKNVKLPHMTKTSYNDPDGHRQDTVQDSLAEMEAKNINSVIETEMIMDQWRSKIHDGHVYARNPTRYQILARKIPGTRRFLVALHDKNRDLINAASLEAGSIQDLAAKARALAPADTRFELNDKWRG